MARWEPGADGRLREAALALFLERGYEQTTVAEIAQRAGVTARTYFRHFADKREVLFSGAEGVRAGMAEAMAGAPADATPVAVAGLALDAAAEAIGHRRDFYRQRQVVVDANVELQERELMKLADLADVLAAGLRERDVPDPEARLVAEAAITVLGRGLPPLGRLARRHGRPRGDPARGPRRAARPTGLAPAQRATRCRPRCPAGCRRAASRGSAPPARSGRSPRRGARAGAPPSRFRVRRHPPAHDGLGGLEQRLGVRGQQGQQLGVGAVGGRDDGLEETVVLRQLEHPPAGTTDGGHQVVGVRVERALDLGQEQRPARAAPSPRPAGASTRSRCRRSAG